MARRDLLNRLADVGEEAITRLADAPRGSRVFGAAGSLRDRIDELQRKVGGIDELERRIAELERRLAERELAPRSAEAATEVVTVSPESDSEAAADAGVASPERASATTKGGRARRSRPSSEPEES